MGSLLEKFKNKNTMNNRTVKITLGGDNDDVFLFDSLGEATTWCNNIHGLEQHLEGMRKALDDWTTDIIRLEDLERNTDLYENIIANNKIRYIRARSQSLYTYHGMEHFPISLARDVKSTMERYDALLELLLKRVRELARVERNRERSRWLEDFPINDIIDEDVKVKQDNTQNATEQ